MSTATLERPRRRGNVAVIQQYDVTADAKKRISLRGDTTKYYHVKVLSNGVFMLEPRVLVPPHAISARTLKMLDQSAANLKKGLASEPIDLSQFGDGNRTASGRRQNGAYKRIKLSDIPPAKAKPGATK